MIVFAVAVCYFLISFIVMQSDIKSQEKYNAQLRTQLADKKAENEELEKLVKSSDLDDYVEQIARRELEQGSVVKGKVTGLTDFGAFVELEGGKTGMIHISEVSTSYVKDIREHLQLNQEVTAKVISISPEGKIALSIKKLNADNNGGYQTGRSRQSGDFRQPVL